MTFRTRLLAGVAAAGLVAAAPAWAADDTNLSGQGMDAPSFQEIDTDGDGRISDAELEAATGVAGRTAVYDEDGDGMLGEDEYTSFQQNEPWNEPGGQGNVSDGDTAAGEMGGTDPAADTQ